MAVLLRAQNVARTADFQVAHGDAEARAEGGELPDGLQTLGGHVGQRLALGDGQVGKGPAAGAPDPSADLVELGEAQPVRVLDNQGVAVGDVHAGLDDGGADQDVDLVVEQPLPDLGELLLAHLAVGHHHYGIRDELLDGSCTAVDGVHPVVQVEHLSATAQLLVHRLGQNAPVMLHDIGLHRLAVLRGLLDGGHVPDAGHRHI